MEVVHLEEQNHIQQILKAILLVLLLMIFFLHGAKKSAKRIAKTENCIDHIILTGDPYPTASHEKNQIIINKIERLKKK